MSYPATLTQHLLQHSAMHPEQMDLIFIMSDLATIGKFISKETNRGGLGNVLGGTGFINVQGEMVQKLDVLANEQCKEYLRATGHFAALASEEEPTVVDMDEQGKNAKYVISFDPLDGSSNIDVNASVATIFSVHRRRLDLERTDERQFWQKGRDQVLAGYILYGASTVLVFTFGNGVHEFTLEPNVGEFLLTRERVTLPAVCPTYSVNEGNAPQFSRKDQQFLDHLKKEKKCSLRYIGTMTADVHRNLLTGGIFLYPAVDKGGTGEFKGKLRLNYEAQPMAWLVEQAGGLATDGTRPILDIEPTSLHQRVPLILGNKDVIEEYLRLK